VYVPNYSFNGAAAVQEDDAAGAVEVPVAIDLCGIFEVESVRKFVVVRANEVRHRDALSVASLSSRLSLAKRGSSHV